MRFVFNCNISGLNGTETCVSLLQQSGRQSGCGVAHHSAETQAPSILLLCHLRPYVLRWLLKLQPSQLHYLEQEGGKGRRVGTSPLRILTSCTDIPLTSISPMAQQGRLGKIFILGHQAPS